MATGKDSGVLDSLPNYVKDIGTTTCVFCPYGAEVSVGDQL